MNDSIEGTWNLLSEYSISKSFFTCISQDRQQMVDKSFQASDYAKIFQTIWLKLNVKIWQYVTDNKPVFLAFFVMQHFGNRYY